MDKEKQKEIMIATTFESMTVTGFDLLANEFGISKLEVLEMAHKIRRTDPRVQFKDINNNTKDLFKDEQYNAKFVDHTKELDIFLFEKKLTEAKISLMIKNTLEKRFGKKLSKDLESSFKPETLVKDAVGYSKDRKFQKYLDWIKM